MEGEAALKQPERLSLRWRWVEATERGDVGISGTQGAMIKISPEARGQVVNRLCSTVAKHCASRLLSKPEIKFSRCCHGVGWTITLSVAAASRVSIDALFTRLVSMYYFSRRTTLDEQVLSVMWRSIGAFFSRAVFIPPQDSWSTTLSCTVSGKPVDFQR